MPSCNFQDTKSKRRHSCRLYYIELFCHNNICNAAMDSLRMPAGAGEGHEGDTGEDEEDGEDFQRG